MNRLHYPGNLGAESAARQSVLAFRVLVCAWCKPRERGAGLGDLSHGICPRHFREMKMKLQNSLPGPEGERISPRARRSRELSRSIAEIAQLRFPFPAPVAAAAAASLSA
jgi:hypothetical protein